MNPGRSDRRAVEAEELGVGHSVGKRRRHDNQPQIGTGPQRRGIDIDDDAFDQPDGGQCHLQRYRRISLGESRVGAEGEANSRHSPEQTGAVQVSAP